MGPQQLETMYDTLIKLLDEEDQDNQDVFSSLDEIPSTQPAQQKKRTMLDLHNDDEQQVVTKRRRTTEAADEVKSSTPVDDISVVSSSSSPSPNASGRFHSDQWYEKYQELVEYQKQHGHCNVPPKYKTDDLSLWRWVKRQRYQYKLKAEGKPSSSMTTERIRLLEAIGITWDSQGTLWNDRYSELEQFKSTKGHCNVPSKYPKNPQLSTWVKCQRRQYKLFKDGKPSNMTTDRIKTLLKLDFVFEPRGGASS